MRTRSKSKTVDRDKRVKRKFTKKNHVSVKYSGRHKVGGSLSYVDIPPILKTSNGGSDSQSSINEINETAIRNNNMIRMLTGGGNVNNTETYTVPTFSNGGDAHSDVPNANSVIRSLMGVYVAGQVQGEYDKNAYNNVKQSGGGVKFKRHRKKNKSNKLKRNRNRKSYKRKNRKF
jgi:hypothetical protein